MPYTAHTWIAGDSANAPRLNNIESQYTEATLSFGPDVFTAGFFLTGYAASGTPGTTTVNVAAGTAYLLQADGTTRQGKHTSSTQTTSTPSTTYHLYLQPDNTFYWNTLNAPATNSLAIANVTTNGSGQIATITDLRPLSATILPSFSGALTLPGTQLNVPGTFTIGDASTGFLWDSGNNALVARANKTSAAQSFAVQLYNGSATVNVLSIGQNYGTAPAWINNSGALAKVAGQATAGSFGVPVDVAQGIHTSIAVTTSVHIFDFTLPADGFYRISAYAKWTNGSNSAFQLGITWTDPDTGASQSRYFATSTTATGSPIFLDGTHTFTAGTNVFETYPITVYAKSGTNLFCFAQDPSGTPSDRVTAYLERLA